MNRSIILGVLIVSAAVPATAHGQTRTIYSSLPLSGPSRSQTKAVNDGARQALQEAGGMAGGQAVKFVTLNDATKRTGNWVPERVAANARRAAQDDSTLAILGPFNSGAAAVMIPITNEAGVPVVSPSNTAIGLTTGGPGANPGEPDKYYPTGERTYFRIMPNDKVQADALATAMRDAGCTRIGTVHDGDVYGKGMGTLLRRSIARLAMKVASTTRIRLGTRGFGSIKGDCIAYTGITANGAPRMFNHVSRKAKLFAGDGVAESDFTAHITASVRKRMTITVSTLAPDAYPGGASFAHTDPYKIYGYEAMKLILDGANAAGATKEALLGWLRTGVQNRASVLGTYSLDANGDTTLRTYGLYGVRGSYLVFKGAITAA
ncbi:MAG TPA: branched-chain amino acid ABC transporter substrate-binding protein [Solirubrobacter sp.]